MVPRQQFARQVPRVNQRQEWPGGRMPPPPNPPTQPPMVAVKPKPPVLPPKVVKECSCDQEATTELAVQVQKLTLLIANIEKSRDADKIAVYNQLTKIEETLIEVNARLDRQPSVDEIAEAVQSKLVLPYRAVDNNGNPVGPVVEIPLDNKTPASFRYRRMTPQEYASSMR